MLDQLSISYQSTVSILLLSLFLCLFTFSTPQWGHDILSKVKDIAKPGICKIRAAYRLRATLFLRFKPK